MVKNAAKFLNFVPTRSFCHHIRLTNSEIIAKRNVIFAEEKARQAAMVQRIEKIKVNYRGVPKDCTLMMNRQLSTPYDCMKHLPEHIRQIGVLAYIDGQPWDMHRPLEKECTMQLAHFRDPNEEHIKMLNKVFWRTCSFLLGYVIERAFKEEHRVSLHSWPAPNITSGSFVYDAALPLQNWTPLDSDLRVLSSAVTRLSLENKIFERLQVKVDVAKNIFVDNEFKHSQVDSVADEEGKVVLYRCGDHIDMSRGPMIANTSFVRNFEVASVHPMETPVGLIYRFQGIAHPSQFTMSPFSRNILKERAKIMNTTGLPKEATVSLEEAERQIALEESEDENEQPPAAHKAAQ